MRVLLLGPSNDEIVSFIKGIDSDDVLQTKDKIDVEYIEKNNIDFIISYGYRHIIKESIIEKVKGKAINLHISFLPWNRGSDPNLWSFIEDTPKGVTIHYVDAGIDTGDIIDQKKVVFNKTGENLQSTYDKLQFEIVKLFKSNWKKIKRNKCKRIPQKGIGTVHKSKDKHKVLHLLVNGWKTNIQDLNIRNIIVR